MWPVPATKVKVQVVSGATIVTYFGLARMMRSAMRTRKSMPPAASITEAAMMTARMISITSTGGEVGLTPNDHQHQQADRAPQAEADAAVARAHPDRGQHDDELQNDGECHGFASLAAGRPRGGPSRHCSNFGLIRFSNEKISSHFSCVSSLRSFTTISCSDLPVS